MSITAAGTLSGYPNLKIVRGDMWGEKCFNCVYKNFKAYLAASKSKSEISLPSSLTAQSNRQFVQLRRNRCLEGAA